MNRSSGGTLAIICSILYRDAGLSPLITGVFASVSTCISPDVPIPEQYRGFVDVLSWDQNREAPLMGSEGMMMFQSSYFPVILR
jgi:hypothetical protein